MNKDKRKTMRNHWQTVRLGEQYIEEETEFTYLRAKVTKDRNTEVKIQTWINKARGALAAPNNIGDKKDQQEDKDKRAH